MDNNLDVGDAKNYWQLQPWSIGVMEYWSVEKDGDPSPITPSLQYSNTPN